MNTDRQIGLVKWFHNQAANANYGFIQHAILGDLFFHERSISPGQDIESLRENAIVVFTSSESKKHAGKLEALKVTHLDAETDAILLLKHFLALITSKKSYSDYNFIQKGVHQKLASLINTSVDHQLIESVFQVYQDYVDEQLRTEVNGEEESIIGILKICRGLFGNRYKEIAALIARRALPEIAHKLWLKDYLPECQIEFVSNVIISASKQDKVNVFSKASYDDKLNIFLQVLLIFENIDTHNKYEKAKELLRLSKEHALQHHGKILEGILEKCLIHYKLSLWLDGFHDILDFDSYKIYTITLSASDQKKFVKKVLSYIHEGKVVISIDELTSLNTFDYDTSKLVEQVDGTSLDYSTSIVLNVVAELKKQTKLETRKQTSEAQHKLYDLVLNQIKDPSDILHITGFFDACEGRCNVLVRDEKDAEGIINSRSVDYSRSEFNKPRNHPICDGRKAVDKSTGEALLSEDSQVEYWWCANQKCFKPSRGLHESTQWEKYSLLDFLTILQVDFKDTDLEIYLNVINKANRFLKHLKCRGCHHILYPLGKTAYAFYGVSNFSCKNADCAEIGKNIYLSHCLNQYCEMEIDSRDSVKCQPPGVDGAKCGWYVCNFCHSCCSTKQLEKRKWVYDNILHEEYPCHLVGHKQLGVVSCNKCGEGMNSGETNLEEYNRLLSWFIEKKDKSSRISKSGKNKLNRWWFILSRGHDSYDEFRSKLTRYLEVGFQVPDYLYNKESQLVSEPLDFNKRSGDILNCKSCGNTVDLSSDLEKSRAIKQFHDVKYVIAKG